MSSASRRSAIVLLAVALVLGAALAVRHSLPARRHRYTARLSRLALPRTLGPRLSIETAYRECADTVADNEIVAHARCPASGDGSARVADVVADLGSHAGDPDAVRALALADLLTSADDAGRLDGVIERLKFAVRLDPGSADARSDLSAAYLVRAEARQSGDDVTQALNAAEEAVALDSTNRAALFNRALAAQRKWLVDEADTSWARYLAADPASDWGREARRRRADFHPAPRVAPPSLAAGNTAWLRWASADRHYALVYGAFILLGEWGHAVVSDDTAGAAQRVAVLNLLADELARRGDGTLLRAVREIRAARGDPGALKEVARRMDEFGRGYQMFSSYQRADAIKALRTTFRGSSPGLRGISGFVLANAAADAGNFAEAETTADRVLAETDSLREPALAARLRGAVATTQLRRQQLEAALEAHRSAETMYARAGETESVGGELYEQAEALSRLGRPLEAADVAQRALRTLRPYQKSPWLHNVLALIATNARNDGLTGAATTLAAEDLGVASRAAPYYQVESELALARILASAGRFTPAQAEIARAERMMRSLPPEMMTYFRPILAETEGATYLQRDPGRAMALLASAAAGWRAQRPLLVASAMLLHARAAAAVGDTAAYRADLDTVITRMRTDTIRDAALRISVLDAAHETFDRMVMFQLSRGRPRDALRYLEEGRASLVVIGDSGRRMGRVELRSRPGEAALEYAMIGDTLLTWVIRGSTISSRHATINADTVTAVVARVSAALEGHSYGPAVEGDLARVYDWLIRPIEGELRDAPLTIVADGEIDSVPFEALRDTSGRGSWLVERHQLRHASSLTDAAAARDGRALAFRTLIVADPAFDARRDPGLPRLPGALAEAEAVRAVYPSAPVIETTAADSAALVAAFPAAEVVHYAGHAVFDDQRPDQSYLVVAPGADGGGSGHLTAATIRHLPLRNVRLVVLSACRTVRAQSRRSGGFAGLSGAFLAAGAEGVVGSVWEVDDRTAQRLMASFHHEYRGNGGDTAAALRQAQLRMIGDPRLRSPVMWAGFRYAGR